MASRREEQVSSAATQQIRNLSKRTAQDILDIFSQRSPSLEVRKMQLDNELLRFALKVSIVTAQLQEEALETVLADSGIVNFLNENKEQ